MGAGAAQGANAEGAGAAAQGTPCTRRAGERGGRRAGVKGVTARERQRPEARGQGGRCGGDGPSPWGRAARGPQKAPTKERITIRLSRHVVESFRATGDGWQTRVDAALQDWLERHEPAGR